MRKVVVAGSILVDKINGIDAYPRSGELAQIRSLTRAPGGLVPNVGRDVRILAPEIPVAAFGKVGDDGEGRFVLDRLRAAGVDVAGVVVERGGVTSFTDVMSVAGGERTFFTYPGASATWGYDDFPFDRVQADDLVLLGYFLLLAKVDAGDGLKILRELKRRGAKTSIDLVTENSGRYRLVRECLPFVDDLIVNETEAARLAGVDADEATLCAKLLELGVRERVVIHSPERGVSLVRGGAAVVVPAFELPPGFIRDKTGAGDAYCAGALVGICKGLPEADILSLGATAAVGALSAAGATGGMRSVAELKRLIPTFRPSTPNPQLSH